jgi:hypothetical protein
VTIDTFPGNTSLCKKFRRQDFPGCALTAQPTDISYFCNDFCTCNTTVICRYASVIVLLVLISVHCLLLRGKT